MESVAALAWNTQTGQREIDQIIIAPMLAGTDVFDMETDDRRSVLGQLTIFTVIPRALAHHMAERLVHQDATRWSSTVRALAWRTVRKSIAIR